jgi:hypothetical protein
MRDQDITDSPSRLHPVPIEIRPHVGAALAASLAHKPRFDIGHPEIIGPAIAVFRGNLYCIPNENL